MFGLSKINTFYVLGAVSLAALVSVFVFVDGDEFTVEKTTTELAAECALSKMTVKMKRAKVMVEHRSAMATIKGQTVKRLSPIKDRTFATLMKGCLSKGVTQKERVNAINSLAVSLAYDDEYQRLMAPLKREQDRALLQRR